MHRLTSGSIGIDHGDVVMFSDFEDDGEMWRGEGPRLNRVAVAFSEAYPRPPHVQVTVSMLDISNTSNARFDVKAENISAKGFEIVFRTWSDTRIARARVAWTAMGELAHDDGWELY